MRITATIFLAFVLASLAAAVYALLMGDPPQAACQFYTVPATFSAVQYKTHSKGRSYVIRPAVEFSYVLHGQRYSSTKLSCVGDTEFGGRYGQMSPFLREAEGSRDIVAWIPVGDPAGGCISPFRPFSYSKVHQVAKLCRR